MPPLPPSFPPPVPFGSSPLAVVQARFGSSRAPGKVLAPFGRRTMLGLLLERLKRCRRIAGVCVATSDGGEDDPVAAAAAEAGAMCVRGSLDDVADRFRLALTITGAEAFVRVNGDSPFLDPALVDRAAALYLAGDCDMVTNVLPRSFPKGQSVEVLNAATFMAAQREMTDPLDKEHVTRYFHERADRYRIVAFTGGRPLQHVQMSVDTPAELEAAQSAAVRLGDRVLEAGMDDVLAAWPQQE
jgi:spore coat polysaccharide biosynthesis protein SpsF